MVDFGFKKGTLLSRYHRRSIDDLLRLNITFKHLIESKIPTPNIKESITMLSDNLPKLYSQELDEFAKTKKTRSNAKSLTQYNILGNRMLQHLLDAYMSGFASTLRTLKSQAQTLETLLNDLESTNLLPPEDSSLLRNRWLMDVCVPNLVFLVEVWNHGTSNFFKTAFFSIPDKQDPNIKKTDKSWAVYCRPSFKKGERFESLEIPYQWFKKCPKEDWFQNFSGDFDSLSFKLRDIHFVVRKVVEEPDLVNMNFFKWCGYATDVAYSDTEIKYNKCLKSWQEAMRDIGDYASKREPWISVWTLLLEVKNGFTSPLEFEETLLSLIEDKESRTATLLKSSIDSKKTSLTAPNHQHIITTQIKARDAPLYGCRDSLKSKKRLLTDSQSRPIKRTRSVLYNVKGRQLPWQLVKPGSKYFKCWFCDHAKVITESSYPFFNDLNCTASGEVNLHLEQPPIRRQAPKDPHPYNQWAKFRRHLKQCWIEKIGSQNPTLLDDIEKDARKLEPYLPVPFRATKQIHAKADSKKEDGSYNWSYYKKKAIQKKIDSAVVEALTETYTHALPHDESNESNQIQIKPSV